MPKPQIYPLTRLTVDGQELAIQGFTYERPPNALGARVSVQLANPRVLISSTASVTFELGVKKGAASSYFDLVRDGNLSGRQARIEYSGDTLRIDALNSLADRWLLAPRQNIILYDSDKVEFSSLTTGSRSDLVDEDSVAIEPELIARRGLTLKEVLHYAYVEGCKFTKVITNIPDYPVRRADFGLSAGYHAAAQQFVALFSPVYFADDNETLYILDIEGTLPTGMIGATRALLGTNLVALDVNRPSNPICNGVLLTYKDDLRDESNEDFPSNATDRVATESTPESGVAPGARGWSKQTIETHFKEFHDDPNDSARVTRSIPWKIVINSYAGDESTSFPTLASRETITDKWAHSWRLKIGYEKQTEARIQLPYGEKLLTLANVQSEVNQISWVSSQFNPDEFIKIWEITETEGLILIEGEFVYDSYNYQWNSNVTAATPLLQATTNRQVTQDGFQEIIRGPISTLATYYRDTGTNQVDGISTKTDHLIPNMEASRVSQNISQRKTNVAGLRSITMLLRDEESEAIYGPRVPEQVNAGDVPFDIALPIALRHLDRAAAPPSPVELELPYFDAALRRGSLRKLSSRAEETPTLYLTLGDRINGSGLDSRNPEIKQTVSAILVIKT